MPLTDTAIKKIKPSATPVKLSDGRGLYLLVNPVGSKLWRWKYRVLGKEKVLALGAYPDVSLAQAREGMEKARKMLAGGDDPMAIRKADKVATRTAAENSFESVARKWWSQWKPARSEQHAGQVMRRFEANVFPHIDPCLKSRRPNWWRCSKQLRREVSTTWQSAHCKLQVRCFAMPLRMGWPRAIPQATSSRVTFWPRAKSTILRESMVKSCPGCCAILMLTRALRLHGLP